MTTVQLKQAISKAKKSNIEVNKLLENKTLDDLKRLRLNKQKDTNDSIISNYEKVIKIKSNA